MSPTADGSVAQKDSVLLLVHGTWSSPKTWKTLVDHLVTEYKVSSEQIIHFAWSGKNSSKARAQAAVRLSTLIDELPNRRVTIVGHSHGGTVAALCLKHLKNTSKVAGVVALSSPFPVALQRNIETAAVLSSIVLSFAVFGIIAILLALLIMTVVTSHTAVLISMLVSLYGGLPAIYFLLPRCFAIIYRRFHAIEEQIIALHSYGEQKDTPLLCVTAKGDEAFGYLGVINTIVSLPLAFLRPKVLFAISAIVALACAGILCSLMYIAWPTPMFEVGVFTVIMGHVTFVCTFCILSIVLLPFVAFVLIILSGVMCWLVSLCGGSSFGFGLGISLSQHLVNVVPLPTPIGVHTCIFHQTHVPIGMRHTGIHKLPHIARIVDETFSKAITEIDCSDNVEPMTYLKVSFKELRDLGIKLSVAVVVIGGLILLGNYLTMHERRQPATVGVRHRALVRLPGKWTFITRGGFIDDLLGTKDRHYLSSSGIRLDVYMFKRELSISVDALIDMVISSLASDRAIRRTKRDVNGLPWVLVDYNVRGSRMVYKRASAIAVMDYDVCVLALTAQPEVTVEDITVLLNGCVANTSLYNTVKECQDACFAQWSSEEKR